MAAPPAHAHMDEVALYGKCITCAKADRFPEPVSQYSTEWRERYGVPADLPAWASDLERALVEGDVADWRGGRHPHPSNIALVVARFLADLSVAERAALVGLGACEPMDGCDGHYDGHHWHWRGP